MEHIDFNILFRWFVGLGLDAPVWDHSTFTKNRERFLESEVAHQFFGKVVEHARQKGLLSDDHFTVDGTLIEAWASMKSFQPKTPSDSDTDEGSAGKNPEVDFHGEKRANATHESKTDPDARLYKKSAGSASKLCYMGHVLMENRNGLVVKNTLTHASGTAEREAALLMMVELGTTRRRTLGGDKGYDADTFVQALRDRNIRSLPLPPSFRSSGHRASAALPRPSLTRNSPPEEGGGIRARYCRALLFRSRDSSQVSISRHRGLSGSTQFDSKQGRAPSLLSFRHIRTLAEEGSAGRE
jgi:IS5 family transposase